MRQVERGGGDELAFGADAFEEHDQLQLEEDHWVDAGPTALGIQILRPRADEAEIELRFQVPVEVVCGDEILERDGDRLIKAAGFGGTEHRGLPDEQPTTGPLL